MCKAVPDRLLISGESLHRNSPISTNKVERTYFFRTLCEQSLNLHPYLCAILSLFYRFCFSPFCRRIGHAQSDEPLRVIAFGAHPDDAELKAGGVAYLWAQEGAAVKFVSMTNGDVGHFEQSGGPLAQRRAAEVSVWRGYFRDYDGSLRYPRCGTHADAGEPEEGGANHSRMGCGYCNGAPAVRLSSGSSLHRRSLWRMPLSPWLRRFSRP